MKTILTWGIGLLLGFALRARGQEIIATFYPNNCVNYFGAVKLLNAPDLRNVRRTALLPADCSEREARTVRHMLEALTCPFSPAFRPLRLKYRPFGARAQPLLALPVQSSTRARVGVDSR